MQGARHDGPPHGLSAMITIQQLLPMDIQMPMPSSGSEILDPDIGSQPNNSVSMQPSDLPEKVGASNSLAPQSHRKSRKVLTVVLLKM
ncbi:hypothetical protein ACP70R_013452 [Stipagrostis hirtigluma subsp. patula]